MCAAFVPPPRMCIADQAIDVDSIASRAASAMSRGRAHVEPLFLSSAALDSARADMLNVFGESAEGSEFDSLETDLMNVEFRKQLASSLPFAALLTSLDEMRTALRRETGRALLDGGGLHLMRYPVGSKFMCAARAPFPIFFALFDSYWIVLAGATSTRILRSTSRGATRFHSWST